MAPAPAALRSARRGQAMLRLASLEGARPVLVGPGDLLGRHGTCALRLDDPRVSEVHAAVRQRGRRLHLAAIGGVLRVGGAPLRDLLLRAGLRVQLVPGVVLDVLSVQRPTEVLAVQVGDLPPQELVDPCYSLRPEPRIDLVPGQFPDALARLIDGGDTWRILLPSGEAPALRPGKTFQIRRVPVHVCTLPTRSNGAWTAVPGQWRADPLSLRFARGSEVVHILRPQRHDLTLTGRSAELLRALHSRDDVARPEALAMDLWPGEAARFAVSPAAWRRRLARVVEDLRTVLRSHGVRDDLVRDDGLGNVELYLQPQDGLDADQRRPAIDPFDPEQFADEELFPPGDEAAEPWVPLLARSEAETVPVSPAPPAGGLPAGGPPASEPVTEETLFSVELRPAAPAPALFDDPLFDGPLFDDRLFDDFGAEAPAPGAAGPRHVIDTGGPALRGEGARDDHDDDDAVADGDVTQVLPRPQLRPEEPR